MVQMTLSNSFLFIYIFCLEKKNSQRKVKVFSLQIINIYRIQHELVIDVYCNDFNGLISLTIITHDPTYNINHNIN